MDQALLERLAALDSFSEKWQQILDRFDCCSISTVLHRLGSAPDETRSGMEGQIASILDQPEDTVH